MAHIKRVPFPLLSLVKKNANLIHKWGLSVYFSSLPLPSPTVKNAEIKGLKTISFLSQMGPFKSLIALQKIPL